MEKEWRCDSCGKKLGLLRDGRLHLKFARGYEYFVRIPAVRIPATTVCPGCKALNELRCSSNEQAVPPVLSPEQV